MTEFKRDRLTYLLECMNAALRAMETFPSVEAQQDVISAADPNQTGQLMAFIEPLVDSWPMDTFNIFLKLSFFLSDSIIQAAEMLERQPLRKDSALPNGVIGDHMFGSEDRAGQIDIPYAETLSTLIGRNAPMLLVTPCREGPGKVQPHELNRGGWYLLGQIRAQVKIESELQRLGRLDSHLTKVVVAAAWTMVALAAHMHEAVFVTEGSMHLSAVTGGSLTVSVGRGTETIAHFWPSSMREVVCLLREAVQSDEIDALDMMWLAAGLARVKTHSSGWGEPERGGTDNRLFLSHRGPDLKTDLTRAVLTLGIRPTVFLDCLSLPRGLVNRHFVFRSLVRARAVVIIDSPNFQESAWCRKEAWVAEALTRVRRVELRLVKGADQAVQLLEEERRAGRLNTTAPDEPSEAAEAEDELGARTSWVCNRILKDIDYWARTPNLYSSRESKLPLGSVQPMVDWLGVTSRLVPTNTTALRTDLVSRIHEMFRQLAVDAKNWMDGQPEVEHQIDPTADLWATAAQLVVAALSLRTRSYSKMETRRFIVAMNRITYQLLHLLHWDPGANPDLLPRYLLLAAGAVALDLAADDYLAVFELGVTDLVSGLAVCQNGLLMLDVRRPGADRDFLLRLVLVLVANDVGSVGVLQDSTDLVHNRQIDGISLEILPCVTLYPGMESLLPGVLV
jgi:hypothetical protein